MIIIFLGNCMYSSHDRTSYFQKTQNRIAVVPMFALYRKILPNDETIRDLFKSKIILIIAIIFNLHFGLTNFRRYNEMKLYIFRGKLKFPRLKITKNRVVDLTTTYDISGPSPVTLMMILFLASVNVLDKHCVHFYTECIFSEAWGNKTKETNISSLNLDVISFLYFPKPQSQLRILCFNFSGPVEKYPMLLYRRRQNVNNAIGRFCSVVINRA